MLWPWKKRPAGTVPDDIDEARELREAATEEHREMVQQGHAVSRLTTALVERRALNHFGDAIEITFTRRRHA
jgi:hypothetical protein